MAEQRNNDFQESRTERETQKLAEAISRSLMMAEKAIASNQRSENASGTGISRTSYVAIGLLVGTALAVLVILLKELLDTRPKTPEDISQCADIPTLAIIPSTPQNTKRARG